MANIFSNLCECICIHLRRQLDSMDSILRSANGQEIITPDGGFSSSAEAFGLPTPAVSGRGDALSTTGLLMMTFVVLFIFMLLSMRNSNNERQPTTTNKINERREGGGGGGGDDRNDHQTPPAL